MANDLRSVAKAMVAPGKGILAADESFPTIEKRFQAINVASTDESRRNYREMLFTAPNVDEYISGVILFDETLRQKGADGERLAVKLEKRGIMPGIKVDKGAKPLAGFPGEKVTEGLTGLRDRLKEYADLGAKFAKWRAVITIGDGIPSDFCVDANAHALARYAALCQEAGIVPIVEPEVLMDADNSIEVCQRVTERTLASTFDQLMRHRVLLEGIVLKPNMVIAGKKCALQASAQEVAERTVETLRRCVPSAVPGIVFLSGGQSEIQATEHLSLMNRLGNLPWELSFSYGRALQASALEIWAGDQANVEKAQAAFIQRAKCNSAARNGSYTTDMENA